MERAADVRIPKPDRRSFLARISLMSASSLLALPRLATADPAPETTRLKIWEGPVSCLAPQVIGLELLHDEGIAYVQFVNYPRQTNNWPPEVLLSGEADIALSFPPTDILHIDAGAPVVILAGTHPGCVEVIGGNRVKSTRDLKGKTVSVPQLRTDQHIFISLFAGYVGLNPEKDINWVINPMDDEVRLFTEGKIDAFMAGPPATYALREKKVGHVLVNTTTDRPWSHHFCCFIASNREFVRRHPVATKRALRAILKGADLCSAEPKRVAGLLAERGLAPADYTMQMLRDLPFGKWRDYDPDDTLRFYALRMRELGIIKSTPQKIIAGGTDWRFLSELKKELKV